MSEQQTELNELTTQLACLREGDAVILVTDNGSLTATVTANRWRSDGAVVVFEDRDVDRRIHVYTEHYGGWLDPLVDIDDTDKSRRESGLPFGSLVDVYLVSSGISDFYEPAESDEQDKPSRQSSATQSSDGLAEATSSETDGQSDESVRISKSRMRFSLQNLNSERLPSNDSRNGVRHLRQN